MCDSGKGGPAHLVYIDDAEENALVTNLCAQFTVKIPLVWTGMRYFERGWYDLKMFYLSKVQFISHCKK